MTQLPSCRKNHRKPRCLLQCNAIVPHETRVADLLTLPQVVRRETATFIGTSRLVGHTTFGLTRQIEGRGICASGCGSSPLHRRRQRT